MCTFAGAGGVVGAILLLAVISAAVTEPLPISNAVKNLATGSANLVAAVAYALLAPVHWGAAGALAVGAAAGSWAGPAVVRRLRERPLRIVIALAGFGLAIRLWSVA